jgi:AbrB family looped-hinge helix DNA binding protein
MSRFLYSTITSKGQITVPKEVREALALQAGDLVEFQRRDDGAFVIVARQSDIRALKGIVRAPARPVSLGDMDAAIAAGIAERARR